MTKQIPLERTVCLLARRPCAHLDASIEVFGGIFRDHGLEMITTTSPAQAVAHRGPVLIMLVEQYTLATHLIALARAALGRRTAGMVFRARDALTGRRPQTRVKRLLLRLERGIPTVTMMTILPFDLLPEGSGKLFRSWLHDPQLWDIRRLAAPPADRELAERALARADGRPIIVAMGLMQPYKGVDMLAALANDAAFCDRYLLVIAGRQIAGAEATFAAVTGDCVIENRYISDGELYALYDVADYVWAVYAPGYDQASGIFGRSVQFGRTPVVRAGSLVDAYAGYLGVEPVRVEWNEAPAAIAAKLAAAPGRVPPLTIGADVSVAALIEATFGSDAGPSVDGSGNRPQR